MATPIINQPQVAILDFEAVIKRPVVVTDADGNDSIAIRPMTILGLSWDHRALDGALAAQFLATRQAAARGGGRRMTLPELWVCHLGVVDYRDGARAAGADPGGAPARRAARRAADARAFARVHARPALGARASCRWARSGTGPRGSRSSRPTAAARSPTTAPDSWSAIRSSASTTWSRTCGRSSAALVAALAEEGVAGPGPGRRTAPDYTGVWVERPQDRLDRSAPLPRRDHARLRDQRRERPAAVLVGRAVRPARACR